jgi:hypothetical protein
MRVPRVRFTVRTLMVAVALAAIILGPVAYLKHRRDRFRALASRHASQVLGYKIDSNGFRPLFLGHDGLPVSPREGQRDLWHRKMKWQYDEAALRPWAPAPPDSPEPDWTNYSDVLPPPRKPATIVDELRRQAYRTRALKELSRQPHYARWLKEQKRLLPY